MPATIRPARVLLNPETLRPPDALTPMPRYFIDFEDGGTRAGTTTTARTSPTCRPPATPRSAPCRISVAKVPPGDGRRLFVAHVPRRTARRCARSGSNSTPRCRPEPGRRPARRRALADRARGAPQRTQICAVRNRPRPRSLPLLQEVMPDALHRSAADRTGRLVHLASLVGRESRPDHTGCCAVVLPLHGVAFRAMQRSWPARACFWRSLVARTHAEPARPPDRRAQRRGRAADWRCGSSSTRCCWSPS